jgi:hypothetical protein
LPAALARVLADPALNCRGPRFTAPRRAFEQVGRDALALALALASEQAGEPFAQTSPRPEEQPAQVGAPYRARLALEHEKVVRRPVAGIGGAGVHEALCALQQICAIIGRNWDRVPGQQR